MTKKYSPYVAKGGHLAVMSELLMRGWNVAIPEVDVGDDIFVVQDEDGTLKRVQVKTSQATPLQLPPKGGRALTRKTTSPKTQNGFKAQFNLPLKQLENLSKSLVHYIFIVRNQNKWTDPIIIRQDYLLYHYQKDKIGSKYKDYLNLRFSFRKNKVFSSRIDMTKYISDYTEFPIIKH